MRLVSICPSNTELATYAGLADHLVGVDNYSDWPSDKLTNLERVGPDLNINMEKVEALNPDLVLASETVPGMEKNIKELKKRGLPYVIVPTPKTLSDIGSQLIWIGEKTGYKEKSLKAHKTFNYWINYYKGLSDSVEEKKTIYWEWWAKPIFTPGHSNWLTEMSELAGGTNIFADHPQSSVKTTWEDVYKRNPDVMAIIWVGVHKEKVNRKVLEKRPDWQSLKASTSNNVYILDEPFFCRPSPRLLIGLMQIANILHPHIYPTFAEGVDPMFTD
ncbi:cobalamin-binding protein [Bacillus sp. A116_S68]|nr:cobalamin-binding protein [Bacillus sp. A116_S68]